MNSAAAGRCLPGRRDPPDCSSHRDASMNQQVFPVPAPLKSTAHVNAETYEDLYRRSVAEPEAFWREQAQILEWITPFTQVKNTRYAPDEVTIEWFADGRLNASYNCLDRHAAARGNEAAI